MSIFRKKKIDFSNLPKHIAFIMDGNGRWAKIRGKIRTYGHKQGVESVEKVIKHAKTLGLEIVSFYAFSTENWKRPQEEVDYIFGLLRDYLKEHKNSFYDNNIKVRIIGDITKLPKDLQKEILAVEKQTKDCDGLLVNVCLNYGSRVEIIRAINNIIKDGVKEVDDKIFASYLQTEGIPDPDLVVRTSGECRLSNFMLYQCAYSELYFPKVYWPDFKEKELEKAIIVYQSRNRRFGKI